MDVYALTTFDDVYRTFVKGISSNVTEPEKELYKVIARAVAHVLVIYPKDYSSDQVCGIRDCSVLSVIRAVVTTEISLTPQPAVLISETEKVCNFFQLLLKDWKKVEPDFTCIPLSKKANALVPPVK